MNQSLPQTAMTGGQCAQQSDEATVQVLVLISGSGSNLQALIDAQAQGQLGLGNITHVLSNRATAYGLQRAAQAGIAHSVLNLKTFCEGQVSPEKRLAYDVALAKHINALKPDLIVCAGWMHIFSQTFLSSIHAPMINLHPSLPGQFVGAHGIEDAFAAFERGEIVETGCMVHEVIEQVDAGRVLATQTIPIVRGDTLASLSERMHQAEHGLLVRTVRDYCDTVHNAKTKASMAQTPAPNNNAEQQRRTKPTNPINT